MIFVTGGTGLLGTHLAHELLLRGHSVRLTFRNEKSKQKIKNLFQYYSPDKANVLYSQIEWVKCDVLDIIQLEEAMKGCEFVYHCAAFVSFNRKDFNDVMKINREGTANVVNVALHLGVKKFCFVSSTSAIGKNANRAISEQDKWTKTKNTSGYSISKFSAEKEVWRGIQEGLESVIINPSVIFGAGDWSESSLTIFKTINSGFSFYSSGANAFVDARDVAYCMVELMNSSISNENFLCTGTNLSFKNLFELIAKEAKVKPPTIKAGKFLSLLALRIDAIKGFFSGKRKLTKETVHSSMSISEYDSSKLKQTLNFDFKPIEETIQNAVKGRLDV
jgi:dihydroflavonol-4-reductase